MKIDFNAKERANPQEQVPAVDAWAMAKICSVEPVVKRRWEKLNITMQAYGSGHHGTVLRRHIRLKGYDSDRMQRSAETLADICLACGIERLADTDELIGRSLVGFVKKNNGTMLISQFRRVLPEDQRRLDNGLPILERYDAATETGLPEERESLD